MQHLFRLVIAAIVALTGFSAYAQHNNDKPAWASRGAASINRERSNDSYEMVVFNSHDVDRQKVLAERLEPLKMHVRTNCNARPEGLSVDSTAAGGTVVYTVQYYDKDNGARHTMQAVLVDDYCAYEDYESNDYAWELYQLYAVGRPDTAPQFDGFELTRAYNAKATAMSIIPGWGQIYKGQTTKGCVIIGLEAVSVAGIIVGEHKRSRMMDDAAAHPEVYDSWKGKANSWRNVRNVCIGVAAATYVYNLIDAATSRGARRVKVNRRAGEGFAIVPALCPDASGNGFGAGMALTYTF